MMKHVMIGGVLLAALLAAAPVQAEIIAEPFTDLGYVIGGALSDFRWTAADFTAGVLDIDDGGVAHGNVVKLTIDGPETGSQVPRISAQANDWLGPDRANHQIWFSFDIEKGIPDANTPLGNNIWELEFQTSLGEQLVRFQGGLGTAKLRGVGSATSTPFVNQTHFLLDGWNQFAVLSDLSIADPDPNLFVYLNGVQVSSHRVDGLGPIGVEDSANMPQTVLLTRLPRGGPGDHTVGTMRFDNILTANENILKLPGDVNFDGYVDIFDVNLVSANWDPVGPTGPTGDANGDMKVDIFDVNLISANWAPPPAPGGGSAVPEPATWLLLGLGAVGLAVVGRRKMAR